MKEFIGSAESEVTNVMNTYAVAVKFDLYYHVTASEFICFGNVVIHHLKRLAG